MFRNLIFPAAIRFFGYRFRMRQTALAAVSLICLLTALWVSGAARADEFQWVDAAGGNFNDPSKWTPDGGPPVGGDTAIFNVGGTYQVFGGGHPSILEVRSGALTFLDGITAAGPSSGATAFIGRFGAATVTIPKDQTLLSVRPISMGEGGQGKLIVDGTVNATGVTGVGAAFNIGFSGVGEIEINKTGTVISNGKLLIGSGGIGEVTVHAEGRVDAKASSPDSAIDIGGGVNSHGKLTVEGTAATFGRVDSDSQINVGVSGAGELIVKQGLVVSLGNETEHAPGLLAGYNPGGNGVIKVEKGVIQALTQTVIGGGGTGRMTITEGLVNSIAPNSQTYSSILGNLAGASGAVAVEPGSTWFNQRGLLIGNLGSGLVSASDGAIVSRPADTAAPIVLGAAPGATGVVQLTGSTTTFDVGKNAALSVGQGGIGLFTSEGVSLEMKRLFVGTASVSTPEAERSNFQISGESLDNKAKLTVHEGISIGSNGKGQAILYNDVSATARHVMIADQKDGDGILRVDGDHTSLEVVEDIRVGQMGKGQFFVDHQATVSAPDGLVVGAFGNGVVEVTHGGKLTTGQANLGTFTEGTSGTATIATDGKWTVKGDVFVGGGGVGIVDVQAAGTLEAKSIAINNGGVVYSNGTIATQAGGPVLNGGKYLPGPSPFVQLQSLSSNAQRVVSVVPTGSSLGATVGTSTIFGDYVQLPEGDLEIDVVGQDPGDFDLLSIIGSANLGGTVVFRFAGFTPGIGAEFEFLNAISVAGEFDHIVTTGLTPDLGVKLRVEGGIVRAVVTAVPEASSRLLAAEGMTLVALIACRRRLRRARLRPSRGA